MRRWLAISICCLVAGSVWLLVISPRVPGPRGLTWLELTDAGDGRIIFAGALNDGEEIVLTWKNSLFNLTVTEVFAARAGRLDLTRVTFADPRGLPPPVAAPEDLDDLYHTGGPFHVEGLARPLTRVVFRIGEIGDPRLTIGKRTIALMSEAGFGGAILMQTRKPGLHLGGSLREMQAYVQHLTGLHAAAAEQHSRRGDRTHLPRDRGQEQNQ
jgi:hypothetical protein